MILSTSAFEVCDGKNFGPRPGPMTAVKCSNILAAWLRAALQGLVSSASGRDVELEHPLSPACIAHHGE
jgi:hypothetical protein